MNSYDTEAGELFLSCMFHDPAAIAIYAPQVDPEDLPFKQRLVWKAMTSCVFEDRAVPTLEELVFRLDNTAQGMDSALDHVGKDYLETLPNLMAERGIHSTSKAALFVERIQQTALSATLSNIRDDIDEALSQGKMTKAKYDALWNDVYCKAVEKRESFHTSARKLADFNQELGPALDAWLDGKPYMTVTTGFRSFDRVLGGGFIDKELHIIGGPPGTTKTTLALHICLNQARRGFKVGFASLEMPGTMLLLRALCADAGLNWTTLRDGGYKDDRPRVERNLKKAQEKLAEYDIFVDDTPGLTTDNVHWQALHLSMTHGIDVMYVDFAQLLTDIADGPVDQAAKIFNRSKDIGKLLDIPMVVLSQITKRTEYSESKLPAQHDIPYKGHDVAGIIILSWDLYRFYSLGQISTDMVPGVSTVGGGKIDCTDPNTIYYVFAKTRFGPPGVVRMRYDREFGRITDPAGLTASPGAF